MYRHGNHILKSWQQGETKLNHVAMEAYGNWNMAICPLYEMYVILQHK